MRGRENNLEWLSADPDRPAPSRREDCLYPIYNINIVKVLLSGMQGSQMFWISKFSGLPGKDLKMFKTYHVSAHSGQTSTPRKMQLPLLPPLLSADCHTSLEDTTKVYVHIHMHV